MEPSETPPYLPGAVASPTTMQSPKIQRATSGSLSLPMNLFSSEQVFTEEIRETAVEVIQRFVNRRRKWAAIEKKLKGENVLAALKTVATASSGVSSLSFQSAASLVGAKEVFEATKWILGSLPKDDGLLSFSRESRSARAILSASMIVSHPVHVLDDGEENSEGDEHAQEKGLLVVASKMVKTGIVGLCDALMLPEGVISRAEIIAAVQFFLFARR